ncbi:MAG: HprK-related kinase B [Desulfobacterales bacterium]|nr:HprK-related kinase B [Desulfobacterales bacterium]
MIHEKIFRKVLIREYRDQFPVHHSIFLKLGDCSIEVASNQTEVIDYLNDYCRPFIIPSCLTDMYISVHESISQFMSLPFEEKPPDPGKTKIKEEYLDINGGRIVRKRLTGMMFIFGEQEHLVIGPCLNNMNQVVNFINNRYIEWLLCRGCLLGHASGIAIDGHGLALAGFSGAGKSTLALHLMRHNDVDFISNDRLIIESKKNELIMHGVAKLPRINPGTALNNPNLISIIDSEDQETFSKLHGDELWNLEHKYDVPLDQCYGQDRFKLNAKMYGLVILNWRNTGGESLSVNEIKPEDKPDLLAAFMKSPGLFFLPHRDCLIIEPSTENYSQYLNQCHLWEFTGRIDFEKAARVCLDLLNTYSG